MMSDATVNSKIHPSAVVDVGAAIAPNVTIGAFCVVGKNVTLEENVTLHSHVVVNGITKIDKGTEIFPFASIGSSPQDLKFGGESSELIIGKNNVIREHVTMNPGTKGGGMITTVGDNGLFMVGSHVAHDCRVGDNVVLANNATLAGHVTVGSFVILGGLSAVHQFVRIGEHAIIGGMTGVEHDVIPFGSVKGDRARLSGLNIIGLKRRGFSRSQIDELRSAYKILFDGAGTFQDRLGVLLSMNSTSDAVQEIIKFIQEDSSRAICQPKGN
jgi:UDP-N-acetylglucosamine acyltransferase